MVLTKAKAHMLFLYKQARVAYNEIHHEYWDFIVKICSWGSIRSETTSNGTSLFSCLPFFGLPSVALFDFVLENKYNFFQ